MDLCFGNFDDNNNMRMYSSISNCAFTLTELKRYRTVLLRKSNADADNSTKSYVKANSKIEAKRNKDRRVKDKDENKNE